MESYVILFEEGVLPVKVNYEYVLNITGFIYNPAAIYLVTVITNAYHYPFVKSIGN